MSDPTVIAVPVQAVRGVTKRCPYCDEVKPLEAFHRHRNRGDGRSGICASCTSTRTASLRQASPEAFRARGRKSQQRQRETSPERVTAAINRNREKNRTAVFDHYGWACACCGSAENLSVDHIAGDGTQHREEIGEGSHVLHRWLVKNDFPDGFQTLCVPCNSSKHGGERCRLSHDGGDASDAASMPASLPLW